MERVPIFRLKGDSAEVMAKRGSLIPLFLVGLALIWASVFYLRAVQGLAWCRGSGGSRSRAVAGVVSWSSSDSVVSVKSLWRLGTATVSWWWWWWWFVVSTMLWYLEVVRFVVAGRC